MSVWIIVFLCPAANGLFLSCALFLRRDHQSSILAAFILSFTLLLAFYILYWAEILSELPREVGIAFGLTYLLGPLLYWYLRNGQQPKIWIHFAPYALYVGYFFLGPLLPQNSVWHTVQVVVQIAHLLAYALTMRQSYQKTTGLPAQLRWQRTMAVAFAGYGLTYLTYYLLVWTGLLQIAYDYMISLASAALIYYAGLQGFRKPQLLGKSSTPIKYEKSALTFGARTSILQTIKTYFDEARPYLDSDVSLQTVSAALEIPRHHISEAINDLEGVNFPEFLTRYRLAEAQRILRNPLESKTKIIEVAYRSGFNNKVSFYQAFKKHLGIPPTTFREQHLLTLSN